MSTDYQYWIDQGEQFCYVPNALVNTDPIHGDLQFQTILAIVSGILTVLTLLMSLGNAYRHLKNYTCPIEQRQVVRIIFTPFFFCLFYFLSICWYKASFFLEPIPAMYEAICMCGIFLLFIAFIVPGAEDFSNVERYMINVQRVSRFKKRPKHNRGSLAWFYVIWIMVFQVLFFRLGYNIASWVFWARACPLDHEPTALQVIEPIFLLLWALGILAFYGRLKPDLKKRGAFGKVSLFKLIVLLQVIQTPIFDNLLSSGSATPTSTISYADLDVGIPAFVVCCEMVIFASLFFFGWPVKEYKVALKSTTDVEQSGPKHPLPMKAAIADVLNLTDIAVALVIVIKNIPVLFGKKPKALEQTQEPPMTQDQRALWQQGQQTGRNESSPDPRALSQDTNFSTAPSGYNAPPTDSYTTPR